MNQLLKSYGIIQNSMHGKILYDTNGEPAAIITGSYASNGKEPWNIRGHKLWIAVACMSKRTMENIAWGGNGIDIPTITNSIVTQNQLNDSKTGTGSGNCVSIHTTEVQMDAAFNDIGTSDELTTKILEYGTTHNIEYPAAEYCNTIVLADGSHMDLPRIEVLMRIYQSRDRIDKLDPTLKASGESSTNSWWKYPYASSEISSNFARGINFTSGNASGDGRKDGQYYWYQALPALEIPAE